MCKPLIALSLMFLLIPAGTAAEEVKLDIYVHEYCPECSKYIDKLSESIAQIEGARVEIKPIISGGNRAGLEEIYSSHGVRDELKGHPTIVLNGHTIFIGQVDIDTVVEAVKLAKKQPLPRVLVYKYRLNTYKVLDLSREDGVVYLGEISPSANTVLPVLEEGSFYGLKPLDEGRLKRFISSSPLEGSPWALLPLVMVTGLIDGINPCAFSVLLFFIAFLYSISMLRKKVLLVGAVYITAIFLVYLGIGLGLLRAIHLTGEPHLIAKAAAVMVILLGIITLREYFYPEKGIWLRIPVSLGRRIRGWLTRATTPSSFVAGGLVGLCTFPCTGGIYIAILGLLALKTTYLLGLLYLVIYNVMFVVPLVAVLALVHNASAVERMEMWKEMSWGKMKLTAGLLMIALGVAVLALSLYSASPLLH